MNIEDFFLERYQQLEQENKSLKQKLESMSNKGKYGVFATNEELKAINITASSYYDVFESQDECDKEKKRLAKIDEEYRKAKENYLKTLGGD